MLKAAEWYDEQRPSLGADFAEAIQIALDSLTTNPLLYRIRARYRRHEVRWLLADRFPYRVIYFIRGETVTVFAVFHAKRSDRAWKERL